MAQRGDKYASKRSSDSIQELSDRLTNDLRRCIRHLGNYDMFTNEWYEMVANVERISNVAETEKNIPKEKANATLWECEEVALRYVLEDGKVNLCLRLLSTAREAAVKNIKANDLSEDERKGLDKLSAGLGVLLKNTWNHVEALQTTDLHLLVEYSATILSQSALSSDFCYDSNCDTSAEVLVLYYVCGLCKRMDDIGESRIMPLLMDKEIFPLVTNHLALHWKSLKVEDLVAGLQILSVVCNTEEFETHEERYLTGDEVIENLQLLNTSFIEELTEEDRDLRREIHPLLDVIAHL